MSKKIISLVLSLAMIVSCFACMASLSVYAVDNTATKTAPVKAETTVAPAKAARTVVDAYPAFDPSDPSGTYPEWHCRCGNVWASVDHNDDAVAPATDLHYLWGAGNCKYEDGVGCTGELIKWTAGYTPAVSMTGNYYLTANVSTGTSVGIGTPVDISSSVEDAIVRKELNIDLNGFNYTKTGTSRTFTTLGRPNAHFSITDTKGTSVVNTAAATSKNTGMIIWFPTSNTNSNKYKTDIACGSYSDGCFYGGTYNVNKISDPDSGNAAGAFSQIYRNATLTLFDGVTVDSSMYTSANTKSGGLFRTEKVTVSGVYDSGDLNIYGATIKGYSTKSGGAGGVIYISQGSTVNIKNADITGTVLGANGGTIAIGDADCTLNIVDSVIRDGKGNNGGNIIIAGANATINISGSTITGGEATSGFGGNIYKTANGTKANINITNSEITDGTAADNGGNINLTGKAGSENNQYQCTVNITGSTISGGTSTGGVGGNIYAGGAGSNDDRTVVTTFTDTTVSGGQATDGGNIYSSNGGFYNYNEDVIVSGGQATGNGGNMYITGSGASYYVNNGKTGCQIINGTAANNGGNIYFNGGTFSPKYSTISGGTATNGKGGNIYINSSCELGGTTVTGGTAGDKGDSIYVTSNNVTFSSSTSVNGEIYLANDDATKATSAATYTLKNSIQLADLVLGAPHAEGLDSKFAYTLNVSNLTSGADITLTVDSDDTYFVLGGTDYESEEGVLTRTIMTGATDTILGYFTVGNTDYHLEIKDAETGAAGLVAGAYVPPHTHVIAGTSASAAAASVDQSVVEYTPVSTEEELTTAIAGGSANIYLATDIALTEATVGATSTSYFINMVTAGTVNLCLNGHTLSGYNDNGSATIRLFQVNAANVILNICDCASTEAEKGGLVYTRDNTGATGQVFYVATNGRVNLYDIRISGASGQSGSFADVRTARFHAYDVKATGCKVSTNGALLTYSAGTSTYSTKLVNCEISADAGCAVYNRSNKYLTIEGGSIYSANAITFSNSGIATLTGVTVSSGARRAINSMANNLKDNSGKDIGFDTTLTLNNCTVTGCQTDNADTNAGTIINGTSDSAHAVILNINGGTITGSTTTSNGGNIQNASTATLNIYGNAVITGGTSGNLAGNIYNAGGTLNIYENAVVTGGTAKNGGNIYTNASGTTNIYGNAQVKDGTANTGAGGNVYNTGTATTSIYGSAQIKDGTAVTDGGNIYNNAVIAITGGTVSGGTSTTRRGGNIYISGSASGEISGATVSDGTAVLGGNIFIGNPITVTATFTGGTATYGGNAYIKDGRAITIDGTFTGGTATEYGNDVFVGYAFHNLATETCIEGGVLTVGSTATVGEIVSVYPFNSVTVNEGATVSSNKTAVLNAAKTRVLNIEEDYAETQAFNDWYLNTMAQSKTDEGALDVRFIGKVDHNRDNYKKAGFCISIAGGEGEDIITNDAYKAFYANGVEQNIANYSLSGDYFFLMNYLFSAEIVEADPDITVYAFLIDQEDNRIVGASRTFKLSYLVPAE